MSNGLDQVREVAAGREGLLRVGFASSTLLSVLPALVRRFRQDRPRVKLELVELASSLQIQALREGAIDVGVVRRPALPGMWCVLVQSETFLVVLPRQHRLATAPRIDLRQVEGEHYVHFPRDFAPYLYDQIEEIWRKAGVRPTVVQEAAEWLTIVGLVEAGLGFSLVPASFGKLQWGGVAYREIEGHVGPTVTTVCAPQRVASPAAEAFLETARILSME